MTGSAWWMVVVLAGCAVDDSPPLDPAPETVPAAPSAHDPAAPPSALLAEWSGCMSFPDFQASGMSSTWSSLAGQRDCQTCHAGGGTFTAPGDPAAFFTAITEHSAHLRTYFAIDAAANAVVPNARHLASVAAAAVPYRPHPVFDSTDAIDALHAFHALTAARKAAQQCDPPRLVD